MNINFKFIPSGAFKIENNSTHDIKISLGWNKLVNEKSFEFGTFNDTSLANRKVKLILSTNGMQNVEEFSAFFRMKQTAHINY